MGSFRVRIVILLLFHFLRLKLMTHTMASATEYGREPKHSAPHAAGLDNVMASATRTKRHKTNRSSNCSRTARFVLRWLKWVRWFLNNTLRGMQIGAVDVCIRHRASSAARQPGSHATVVYVCRRGCSLPGTLAYVYHLRICHTRRSARTQCETGGVVLNTQWRHTAATDDKYEFFYATGIEGGSVFYSAARGDGELMISGCKCIVKRCCYIVCRQKKLGFIVCYD